MDPAPRGSYRRRLLLLSPASSASPAVVKALFPDDLSPVSNLRLTMEQLGRGSVKTRALSAVPGIPLYPLFFFLTEGLYHAPP